MNANTQSTNPVVQDSQDEIVKLVEKFGFKFFGYDENGKPLVVAPNGQVVQLNVAYNFVRAQIAKSSASLTTQSGIEALNAVPNLPQNIDTGLESRIENTPEIKKEVIENRIERQPGTNTRVEVKPETPKVNPLSNASSGPFGDSMKLSFSPIQVENLKKFVARNSRASNKSAARWLSEEFKKFLEEQRLGLDA